MGLFGTSEASSKFKTKKIKEEGCVVTLQVEIPAAKVQEASQNILIRTQAQARLPGFRPGKAPLEVVQKQMFHHIRERVVDQLIREAIPDALKELRLQTVTTPVVSSIEADAGKPMTFQLHVECPPVVQVKNYKKIPIQRKKHPAGDEEVTKRLAELREGNATLQVAPQDAVGKDHYAVLDYEGFMDGKPMKGAKAADQLLDMSASSPIEGLQAGLLGAKRGETREIAVQIDKKPAKFRVTVKEIKSKNLPTLDDEFAKDLGFAFLEELKAKLRALIEEENLRKSDQEAVEQIEAGLLKANPIPVPPALVERELDRLMDRLRSQMLGTKRDWPDAEKAKLREKLRPNAENNVRVAYLLRAVAATEKIEATEQDLQAELDKNLEGAKSDEQKANVRKFFEENKDDIRGVVAERKTVKFLQDAAAVTDA